MGSEKECRQVHWICCDVKLTGDLEKKASVEWWGWKPELIKSRRGIEITLFGSSAVKKLKLVIEGRLGERKVLSDFVY